MIEWLTRTEKTVQAEQKYGHVRGLIERAVQHVGAVVFAATSRQRSVSECEPMQQVLIRSRQTAAELSLLIDSATNYAIYMLDAAGRVTIWNNGAERVKGWSEAEVLGRHCSIFYSNADVVIGKPSADLAYATEAGRFEEQRDRLRKDGSTFPASVTITALHDAGGKLIGFGKVIRDMTDQRATENAIEAREMQLRSILATLPDAMVVINDYGRIVSFSAAAECLFGYTETEVQGQNVSTLVPAPGVAPRDDWISHHMTGNRRRVHGRRKDGSIFPMELAVGEAVGGGVRRFTAFARDLTAQEQTDAQVQMLQSDLLHASRLTAMGTMAATLAHELNQPITAVANYVETASALLVTVDAETLATVREALSTAASETLRAGQIIRRLRQFVARGETDKNIETLPALIDDACALALAGSRQRGITAVTVLDPCVGPVFADRVQIHQVLVNLLHNAVEAMMPMGNGMITISTHRDRDFARVTVADTGPGLLPEIAEQLFEAFVSTKREGLGLGLSICRTIVEAHGGRIWAEAGGVEPGASGGMRFHFTLQCVDAVEDADAA